MASIRSLARTAGWHAAVPLRPAAATTFSISHNNTARMASSQSKPASSTPAPTDPAFTDLEADSSFLTPPLPDDVKLPSPRERYLQRKEQLGGGRLPGTRYQYHPPKYDRGPLHPIQSPRSSDPTARDFVPGPFHESRLRMTYHSTIAADLMTLTYNHVPPGTPKEVRGPRLRSWDGSSPYHKNRPMRPPRGDPVLPLLEKPFGFNNIPTVRSITVATFVPDGIRDRDVLTAARMVLMSITGVKPEITSARKSVSQWGIAKGRKAGCKATITGNEAYDFLDKCIHLVLPQIKDWPGVKGSTGDNSGNLSWGLTPDDVAKFPEVEVNYSHYPARMIPGLRIFVETTATSDRQARLLLGAFGLPFYGELVG